MTTRDSLRALVTAALVVSAATGATAMAQTADPAQSQSQPADTPSMSRQERRQAPESQHAHPRQPDGGMMGGNMMGGNMMGGHMMGGHMRGPSGMGPMGGGHGGGDSMRGHPMMGGCPMMNALPPGNEKLAMRMHGEIMVAIGNILIKNADNIQPKPAN